MIAAQQDRIKIELFGSLEVDYHVKLGWLLHGQILRFCALQYLVYVNRCSPVEFSDVLAVADQASRENVVFIKADRR